MATNVTEKDRTLNEIIEWCEQCEIRDCGLPMLCCRSMTWLLTQWSKLKSTHITRPPSIAALCSVIPGRCRSRSKTRVRTHDEKHPKFCKSSR